MNPIVRKILDVFKNAPEVDPMNGKPYIDEVDDDFVIDGYFSLKYLNEKLAEIIGDGGDKISGS